MQACCGRRWRQETWYLKEVNHCAFFHIPVGSHQCHTLPTFPVFFSGKILKAISHTGILRMATKIPQKDCCEIIKDLGRALQCRLSSLSWDWLFAACPIGMCDASTHVCTCIMRILVFTVAIALQNMAISYHANLLNWRILKNVTSGEIIGY